MMDQQIAPRLRAGLFRERDDMLFAYLSDSDGVNVTSIYETYPTGCFSTKQRPARRGLNAVTGTASGLARWLYQDVHGSSRARWTLPCW
jgi:hypothetical protein